MLFGGHSWMQLLVGTVVFGQDGWLVMIEYNMLLIHHLSPMTVFHNGHFIYQSLKNVKSHWGTAVLPSCLWHSRGMPLSCACMVQQGAYPVIAWKWKMRLACCRNLEPSLYSIMRFELWLWWMFIEYKALVAILFHSMTIWVRELSWKNILPNRRRIRWMNIAS